MFEQFAFSDIVAWLEAFAFSDIVAWLNVHSSTELILGIVAALYKNHSIVCVMLIPFVWPPIKWILSKYVQYTPWKSDDDIPERVDALVVDALKRIEGEKKNVFPTA